MSPAYAVALTSRSLRGATMPYRAPLSVPNTTCNAIPRRYSDAPRGVRPGNGTCNRLTVSTGGGCRPPDRAPVNCTRLIAAVATHPAHAPRRPRRYQGSGGYSSMPSTCPEVTKRKRRSLAPNVHPGRGPVTQRRRVGVKRLPTCRLRPTKCRWTLGQHHDRTDARFGRAPRDPAV